MGAVEGGALFTSSRAPYYERATKSSRSQRASLNDHRVRVSGQREGFGGEVGGEVVGQSRRAFSSPRCGGE